MTPPKIAGKQDLDLKSKEVDHRANTIVAANPDDVYIAQVVSSQPETLEDLEIKLGAMNTDPRNRLALNDELDKIFKKSGFVARWIFKHKQAIDHAIKNRGWTLVTRVFFPELPDHLFSATGVIENGDLILGFMPEKRAEALRRAPQDLSRDRAKNLPIEKWKDGGDKYYKPKLQDEKDGEVINNGIQPDNTKED